MTTKNNSNPLKKTVSVATKQHGQIALVASFGLLMIILSIILAEVVAMAAIMVNSIIKFGLAALIIVPICFALAAAVRKIPGVSKVL